MTERRHTARLVLTGHIIDSMMLPQIMDLVMDLGGNFTIEEIKVGQHKTDTSLCRMEVVASSAEQLDRIVRRARALGASAESEEQAQVEKVAVEGVFPEGFYSTSNLPTEVLIGERWVQVDRIEMDCAIAMDRKEGARLVHPVPGRQAGDGGRGRLQGRARHPPRALATDRDLQLHGQRGLRGETEESPHQRNRGRDEAHPRIGRPHRRGCRAGRWSTQARAATCRS